MAGYRAAAGFAIEKLNKAPQTIPNGARVHRLEFAGNPTQIPPADFHEVARKRRRTSGAQGPATALHK